MEALSRISFYDKLEFEARNHFLARTRSAQKVGHSPGRGVIFQPRYHQKSFVSPNFVFHCKQARAGCKEVSKSIKRSEACRPVLAYDKNGTVEDFKCKFCVHLPVLGTRDGLTEKARYNLLTSKTPYTNPKPHDFRPVSNGQSRVCLNHYLLLSQAGWGSLHSSYIEDPRPHQSQTSNWGTLDDPVWQRWIHTYF